MPRHDGYAGEFISIPRTGNEAGAPPVNGFAPYVIPAPLTSISGQYADRSGAATASGDGTGLKVSANTTRKLLVGQNVSANPMGYNEFGGTAVIGNPGTYTVPAGSSFAINTPNQVNFVGNGAVTITEIF